MTGIYKVVRFIIVSLLLLVVVVPSLLYVILSLPAVQDSVRKRTETELSRLLGTDVSIGSVVITPFNKVYVRRVAVVDCQGDTALKVRRIGAGVSFGNLIWNRKIVFNFAEVLGLEAKVYRDSIGAPTNIDCIIDALKPKDKNKPPTEFDFRINAIVIRQARLIYDVKNQPYMARGIDPNHIDVKDLNADLRLPSMKRDDYSIDLRRLAFKLTNGFTVNSFGCNLHLTPSMAALSGLKIVMPGSQIAFSPVSLEYGDWNSLDKEKLASIPVDIELLPGSYFRPADIRHLMSATLPQYISDSRYDLSFKAEGTLDDLSISDLHLAMQGADSGNTIAEIYTSANCNRLLSDTRNFAFEIPSFQIKTQGQSITKLIRDFAAKSNIDLSGLGNITADISASGHLNPGGKPDVETKIVLNTAPGNIDAAISISPAESVNTAIKGSLGINGFNVKEALAGMPELKQLPGLLDAGIEADLLLTGTPVIEGTTSLRVKSIEYLGNEFENIYASVRGLDDRYEMALNVSNPGLDIGLDALLDLNDIVRRSLVFDMTANDVQLSLLGDRQGNELSFTAGGNMALITAPDGFQGLDGTMEIRNLVVLAPGNKSLDIKKVDIEATASPDTIAKSNITLTSDIFEANFNGRINPFTIFSDIKSLGLSVMPSLSNMPTVQPRGKNDFAFNFRLLTTKPLEDFIKIPVQVRYPVTVEGAFSGPTQSASLDVDAPYLWQGNKEINATSMSLKIDADRLGLPESFLTATTSMPTKNGKMKLDINMMAQEDQASANASWKVDSDRDFSGTLNMLANVKKSEDTGKPVGEVSFLPSRMIFNDTVWTVSPSTVTIENKSIDIDRFRVGRQNQYISIDGTASAETADSLTISLRDVDLDYVFETLNISNAMFGGTATGTFHACQVMSPRPVAFTDSLRVKNLKYNFSLMGDALIKASYDAEKPAVNLNAYISQPNGRHSTIDGYIKPTSEGYIDLDMQADKIEVGFMKPFMEAFASAVHGYASGKAHLYGTFHDVNMTGDIFAEDLSLKLDFTGTTYWATDSVHLEPGYIDLSDITLRDRDGHTGKLNGWLRHTNFHEPRFRFNITEARDLLVYDMPETPSQVWYGTIYGNGSANIDGVPGRIDIRVDMSTAPKSTFTFVLSDAEEAYDYTFITFRDRNAHIEGIEDIDYFTPDIVKELRKTFARKTEEENSSIYDMNLTVRVNNNARLVVVMDPVGGDAIRARGSGVMTMSYNSASEELGLRGDYTLESGTYNFTFQDIIRKDFRIYPGSTIRFNGDPYSAQLDITAGYRITANLSDLDESFLDDPELTRTSVPVEAEIVVTGDMRQPEISYDFSFPTLKDDVKRKVNSIVSTEDMRARQMLYLLALGRFYTPEYMSATKGNELFSVASSTLSSQIGNVFGQLTDKFSIAPSIRSDRGDFSDTEFDLALSSSLLNNRLLFNGNFGYRDKALNNNTFIGDFDIEYLLNRSGTLRLKAYNRYNDQNFYVKNALTTQGVGLVYRRDFDDMLSFLKAFRRKKKENIEPTDSVKEQPADSLLIFK